MKPNSDFPSSYINWLYSVLELLSLLLIVIFPAYMISLNARKLIQTMWVHAWIIYCSFDASNTFCLFIVYLLVAISPNSSLVFSSPLNHIWLNHISSSIWYYIRWLKLRKLYQMQLYYWYSILIFRIILV